MIIIYYMMNKDSLHTNQSQDSIYANTNPYLNQQLLKSSIQSEPLKPNKQRLNSLDVFRGLTMVGMILVDNEGPFPPWFLDHADWNGLTPADLIFPGFLFIMGVAVPLAVSQRNPIRLRTLLRIIGLFGIGVLLSLFNHKFNFYHVRIMGILQRISLSYAIIVFIHWITRYGKSKKLRIVGGIIILAFLIVYLVFMLPFQNLDIGCPHSQNLSQFCNFGAYIDRQLFGKDHMIYPNEPQGLVSTLTAVANAFAGYVFSLIMMDYKLDIRRMLLIWLIISIVCGIISIPLAFLVMPLNKKIWSISFTFLTICISGISLILSTLFIDMLGSKGNILGKIISVLIKPFIWLGRNPLAVFVLMDAFAILLIRYVIINGKSAWGQFYHYVFASWITNEEIASTLFSFFFVILWTIVAGIMYRFKVFIRL